MYNISKLLTKGIQYKVSIFAKWKLGVSTNIKITVINMARKLGEKVDTQQSWSSVCAYKVTMYYIA